MTRYALFLRGINVGGIKVAMPKLREVLEKATGLPVKTWLATGNIALDFDRDAEALKTLVEATLTREFEYDAHVIVRDFATLQHLVDAYPFAPDDAFHRYVILCEPGVATEAMRHLAGNPDLRESDGDLYWRCRKGETTTSATSKTLNTKSFKTRTTMRNLNTLERMLA